MFEIERRFLVNLPVDDILHEFCSREGEKYCYDVSLITQYYLADTGSWGIRVREQSLDGGGNPRHFLTMKKSVTDAKSIEIEHLISDEIYTMMVRAEASNPIVKRRYTLSPITEVTDWEKESPPVWMLDEYLNPEFNGLVILEAEMQSENYPLVLPAYIGEEVTQNSKYRNYMMFRELNKEPA